MQKPLTFFVLFEIIVILIYSVMFTDLILEKGFVKVENVRILSCFTNKNDYLFIKVACFNNSVDLKIFEIIFK